MGMLHSRRSKKARNRRGTEEFYVPAILAAISAGTQYANTSNANSRAQAATTQGIINQQKLQQQGNSQVNQLTKSIAADSPNAIAAKATGDYVNTLRKNAAGTESGGSGGSSILFGQPTSSLPVGIKGSTRYNADNAASQGQVQSFGNQEASEMGNIDAATRMRVNEGLSQQGLGVGLNELGAQSYTQAFADRLRASAAGQQSPWLNLLSGVTGKAASGLATNMTPTDSSIPTVANQIPDGSDSLVNPNLPNPSSTVPLPAYDYSRAGGNV